MTRAVELLLVGGGHAHAFVLQALALARKTGGLTGQRVALVTPQRHAAYSGMVPAWLQGRLAFDAITIDMAALAHQAGVSWVQGHAMALDLAARQLQVQHEDGTRTTWAFQTASLNVGSTLNPPGTTAGTLLSLRPLERLQVQWDALLQSAQSHPAPRRHVHVAGGGPAATESILAVLARLRALRPDVAWSGSLHTQSATVLPDTNMGTQRAMQRALQSAGVTVRTQQDARQLRVGSEDLVLWATGAEAWAWPAAAGLAADARGFVQVGAGLQSTSHPFVFAAGDCAAWTRPLPKAGVIAVRMGPHLAQSLLATLGSQATPPKLKPYAPRRNHLALLGTADGRAIATYGPWHASGAWVQRWKDRIDQRFVGRFSTSQASACATIKTMQANDPMDPHPAQAAQGVEPSPKPTTQGALSGLRIIEFAGLGPCPMAGMLLADMGADVIVVDRPPLRRHAGAVPIAADGRSPQDRSAMNRHKRSIALDLKLDADRAIAWQLLDSADALIEGFRPGVMERLGFAPGAVAQRNPRLVFGRVTGWGQDGPLAQAAGHDLNYVALTGVLDASAREGETPNIPGTIVGDMGGGAMFLAFGLVCALLEARRSGQGQVVDAAMIDGVANLAGLMQQMRSMGRGGVPTWTSDARGNFFRGAAPFYDVFTCLDGRMITLGAIEGPFYAELLQRLGLTDIDPKAQFDRAQWPAWRERVKAVVATKTQAEWRDLLEGTDACFAPVLSLAESPTHPHMAARQVWTQVGPTTQPSPAPRLSRTPAKRPAEGSLAGEHTAQILADLGWTVQAILARERGQG